MTNLLAILISLAMLFTGAIAPVAAPASRTLTVKNLTVRHNDEEVALTPYASLGVCLPFQAQADESGILVFNDKSGATLKIDGAQIDAMLDGMGLDEDGAAVFALMGDYIKAYGDILRLMGDPEAMRAIQQKGEALYDQMIDRGAGTPDTLAYNDEIIDVTSYEYDVTAAQIGALTDAVYASDDALANYASVYFRLLDAMPEASGLRGLDSFSALMEKFANVSMHVNEAISEDGLNVSDVIVDRRYLGPEDRILIIDDFLANGKALEGLMDLIRQAGATLCGIGIAIEKGFQGAGDRFRAQGIRLESLAIVDKMDGEKGTVTFR